MSKAAHGLSPAVTLSKLDTTDRARAVFKAAFSQARRQLRPTRRHGLGSRYGWTLDALRNRFGAGAWPITQKAVAIAFDAATIAKAATGSTEELAREGMLTRCVRLEAAPRGLGWLWAFTFDDLASPNSARSLRRGRAIRLWQDRQRRAEVACAMAQGRRRVEAGTFYALTDKGRVALAGSEVRA